MFARQRMDQASTSLGKVGPARCMASAGSPHRTGCTFIPVAPAFRNTDRPDAP